MAVDLSFPAVVNAAGGLLFLVEGLVVLAIARGTRRGRLVGGFATVFGANYLVNNLLVYAGDVPAIAWTLALLGFATFLFAAALGAHLLRPASTRARALVVAASVAVLGALTVNFLAFSPELIGHIGATPDIYHGILNAGLYLGDAGLFFLLAASIAHVRALPPEAARERRAAILLTLAFGLYATFFLVSFGMQAFPAQLPGSLPAGLSALAFGAITLLTLAPLAGATPAEPVLGRRAFLALTACGLAGIALGVTRLRTGTDLGAFGIVRTIGAVLLALAILRYDLLGVALPRLVRRGALATAALAALLIGAQVAQNFLSTEQSMLVGGIVSGALIVAAQPLQRAMERRSSDDTRAPAPESAAALTYRAAVRAALDDGAMTPREEEHLAEVAHHLRLSPLDALRLRREVEDELRRGRGG